MKPYGDCIYCGGEVMERKKRVDCRIRGQLFILENVCAGVCVQCGEMFFRAEIAKNMEEAVKNAGGEMDTIPIPVIRVAYS